MCIEVMVALCAPPCRFMLILYDFAGLLGSDKKQNTSHASTRGREHFDCGIS